MLVRYDFPFLSHGAKVIKVSLFSNKAEGFFFLWQLFHFFLCCFRKYPYICNAKSIIGGGKLLWSPLGVIFLPRHHKCNI